MRVTKESVVMRKEDPTSVLGIPLLWGYLGYMRIDEVEDDNDHVLTYRKDGTLAENYRIVWLGKQRDDGSFTQISRISSALDLVHLLDFDPTIDTEKLQNFILSLKDAVPVTIESFSFEEDDELGHTVTKEHLVVGNIYEYYADIEDYELEASFENFKLSDKYEGQTFEWWKENVETSYKRTCRLVPNAKETCEANLYTAAVLAKLAPVIQKRYNMIHFDEAALDVAQYISKINFMNDDGNIVLLSLTAFDSFLERVKSNIRVSLMNYDRKEDMKESLNKAYNINI